jgi:hypothetical protein
MSKLLPINYVRRAYSIQVMDEIILVILRINSNQVTLTLVIPMCIWTYKM